MDTVYSLLGASDDKLFDSFYNHSDSLIYWKESCQDLIQSTNKYTEKFDKHIQNIVTKFLDFAQFIGQKLGSDNTRDFFLAIIAIAVGSLLFIAALTPICGVTIVLLMVRIALMFTSYVAQSLIFGLDLIEAFRPPSKLRSAKKKESDWNNIQIFYKNFQESLPNIQPLKDNAAEGDSLASNYIQSLKDFLERDCSENALRKLLSASCGEEFSKELSPTFAQALIEPVQKKYKDYKKNAQTQIKVVQEKYENEIRVKNWAEFFGKFKMYTDFKKIADLCSKCSIVPNDSQTYLFRDVLRKFLTIAPFSDTNKASIVTIDFPDIYHAIKTINQIKAFLVEESQTQSITRECSNAFVNKLIQEYVYGRDPQEEWESNLYWTKEFQDFWISICEARKTINTESIKKLTIPSKDIIEAQNRKDSSHDDRATNSDPLKNKF